MDAPMEYRYLLFYKPYDVLSQFTDADAGNGESASTPRRTLKDYIPVPSVYPVGRLDRDSEGLLLLTNDGGLQHRLSHPRFAHPRTYWVQVELLPDEVALRRLRQGVTIQNYRTKPAVVQLLPVEPLLPPRTPPIRYRKNVPTAWLEMTIAEGKNRQVRRMTAAVGFPTLRLVRVALGVAGAPHQLRLEGLQPGEWRELIPKEVEHLKSFAYSSTGASLSPIVDSLSKQNRKFITASSLPNPNSHSIY